MLDSSDMKELFSNLIWVQVKGQNNDHSVTAQ